MKPDWVKIVWPFPECNCGCIEGRLDVTVIELSLNAIEIANFKTFSADSTIVGSKNGINIIIILNAFQATVSKLEEQLEQEQNQQIKLKKQELIKLEKEHIIKDGFNRLQLSICSVDYHQTGTGSIIKMEFPESSGIWRYLFITAFHVAPITQSSEVTRLKLVFEDKTIGNVNLTPDWVKTLWPPAMNDDLDFIIIEFSPIAMKA